MQGLTRLWVLEVRGVSEVPRESETGQGVRQSGYVREHTVETAAFWGVIK